MTKKCLKKNISRKKKSGKPTTRKLGAIIPKNTKQSDARGLKNTESLAGKVFNRLTVQEFSHVSQNYVKMWSCKCVCGKITLVAESNLCRNQTKSCGCLRSENARKKCINLEGQQFGRLRVLSRANTNGHVYWDCVCQCGKRIKADGVHLRRRKIKSCGCLKKRTGKQAPAWKHSLTDEERTANRRKGYTHRYRRWRSRTFQRDGFICQISGAKGKICAHHIEPYSKNPLLRYRICNGITLAEPIHRMYHKIFKMKDINKSSLSQFKIRYDSGEFDRAIIL